jgi:hypothetical protein
MRDVRTIAAVCSALLASLTTASHARAQDIGGPAPAATTARLRPFDTTAAAVTETMRRELARVQKAETDYYVVNGQYAASLDDLGLEIDNGTMITIDSAGTRTYHAVATNPLLPGAELELAALAPPAGMAAGRGRRPADSSGASPDSTSTVANDDGH